MLKLNEKEMEIVASEFFITVEELKREIEKNDDIAIFDTYERFFYWLHDNTSEEELIKLLFEGKSLVDEAKYCKLEDGKTVFMYQ